ncbi:hypothetical protein GGR51DRAFT_558032 [Nemania sp. FL0031]|nr:hypothetical protein GGR51DRAFT_558032 [Nemania sp. FL0031]
MDQGDRANRPHPSPNFNFARERGFLPSPSPCPDIHPEFLKPYVHQNHKLFRNIVSEISTLDGDDSFASQWGTVKKNLGTMPNNDDSPHWPKHIRAARQFYKEISDLMKPLYREFEKTKESYDKAYDKACKSSEMTTADQEALNDLRSKYIDSAEAWFKTSLETAQRRLDFMDKHPLAFSRGGTKTHLEQVNIALENSRDACREILRYRERERRRLAKHGESSNGK